MFGVLGATAVEFRRRGISVWQTGIGALIGVNLLLTFVVPGISIGGHLGGLAAGTLLGAVMMLRRSPSARATVEGVVLAAAIGFVSLLGAIAVAGG